ncbi:MAG: aspartate ammonia-lyase [Nitrospirota bacterium]|nr:aspartate ammonia-lyase [Nitrospirota bacterium]
MAERVERDFLGEKTIPSDALYGIQTLRATENFPISGLTAHRSLIWAIAAVKMAGARTNMALGRLDRPIGEAIVQAAGEVFEGMWEDQFVVDVFQAGAGTSFNMNANEVIANRALELLDDARGNYRRVHPNDHVNMAQSTNDVFPTSLRLAGIAMTRELLPVLVALEEALSDKSKQFNDVIKSGRTHLQDAPPIRLGDVFHAYATAVGKARVRIQQAAGHLEELGIGGTAIGTGVNAGPEYRRLVVEHLGEITGFVLHESPDLIEMTQNMADFTHLSACLRELSLTLIRIANDLRLMSSGPNTGLGEIDLPPVQPGSSIMPGKVNPVMAEMLDMVCFQVVGNDTAVAMAVQAGQLELNVMMPLIAHNLLSSMEILKNAVSVFAERCVKGITAHDEHCRNIAEKSMGLAALLNPYIGYEAAAEAAKEAVKTGATIREIVVKKGLMTAQEFEKLVEESTGRH